MLADKGEVGLIGVTCPTQTLRTEAGRRHQTLVAELYFDTEAAPRGVRGRAPLINGPIYLVNSS